MTRFGFGASPPAPGDLPVAVEYVALFRFPVSWAYLNGSPADSEQAWVPRPVAWGPPAPEAPEPILSAPPVLAPARIDAAPISGASRIAPGATAQWEMVIPKMARPQVKPSAARLSAATEPAPVSSIPASPQELFPPAEIPASSFTSSLLLYTPDDTFVARFWRQIAVAAFAIVAIGFVLWGRSGNSASATGGRTTESSSMSGWSRRSILPPGRLMSVYEPSRDESDYRIEFGWVPDAKGVGWVFRTRDAGEYYATRLTLIQPGANLVLATEHFSVFGGVESAHLRKVIPLANNSGLVRVRMDATGPAFTLSLQGSPVDYWTDPRLTSGAIGFYDERGQRPEVQSLRFTFTQKGAARTAETSLR